MIVAKQSRAHIKLKRKIADTFGSNSPKTERIGDPDLAIEIFIAEAHAAILSFDAHKVSGVPVPPVTMALLRKIVRYTEHWQRRLERSKPPIRLEQLASLRVAAKKAVELYARPRGKTQNARRHALVADLYDAYTTAWPSRPRGFQPVANAVLKEAALEPLGKHDLSALRKQIKTFTKPANRKKSPDK